MKGKAGLLGNKRAISPVVATVILVAVTIVVAVAVAYWMGSIAGLYTRFEKLEIASAVITKKSLTQPASGMGWEIKLDVKNSGTQDATVNGIFINNKPLSDYVRASLPDGTDSVTVSVKAGYSEIITIHILEDTATDKEGFTAGTSIEIKLHTANGNDYPRMITLS